MNNVLYLVQVHIKYNVRRMVLIFFWSMCNCNCTTKWQANVQKKRWAWNCKVYNIINNNVACFCCYLLEQYYFTKHIIYFKKNGILAYI